MLVWSKKIPRRARTAQPIERVRRTGFHKASLDDQGSRSFFQQGGQRLLLHETQKLSSFPPSWFQLCKLTHYRTFLPSKAGSCLLVHLTCQARAREFSWERTARPPRQV